MSDICTPCGIVSCVVSPDVANYSLQFNSLYNSAYSFVVNCPAGYICPAGYFPRTVIIRAGIKVIPFPPPGATSFNVQGCLSVITVTIPGGASDAAILLLMIGALEQWAAQQAVCDAITETGIQPKAGGGYSYFNAAQSVGCPDGLEMFLPDDYPLPSGVEYTGGELTIIGGIFAGFSKAEANAAVVSFLQNIMAQYIALGDLLCGYWNTEQSFTCPDTTVETIPAFTYFSVVSQADADAQALAAAEAACPSPPVDCTLFESIVWGAPVINESGGATGSISATGNLFSGASSNNGSDDGNSTVSVIGTVSYTGNGMDCCVAASMSGVGASAFLLDIRQDGNLVLHAAWAPSNPISFPLSFTLIAGVGSVISIAMYFVSPPDFNPPSNIAGSGTIGSC